MNPIILLAALAMSTYGLSNELGREKQLPIYGFNMRFAEGTQISTNTNAPQQGLPGQLKWPFMSQAM